jgi:hypothetical protein
MSSSVVMVSKRMWHSSPISLIAQTDTRHTIHF